MNDKKISPQAIVALKEALPIIAWVKDDLKEFLKLSLDNPDIVETINWKGTKRQSIKELIERMTRRQDLFKDDLINLLLAVTDLTAFPYLEYWDDDGSKQAKAKQAVETVRKYTKGYIQATEEQKFKKERQQRSEDQIIKNRNFEDELIKLKDLFNKLVVSDKFQQRGYQFEDFLYKLFLLFELDPKRSFKNYGEHIDGAFTHDGTDYLLEAKWKNKVDRTDLAAFTVKIQNKIKIAMGLLITVNGLTPQAISPEFKSIIIMDGSDIISILDKRISLPDLLYKKRRKAIESGNIYVPFHEL